MARTLTDRIRTATKDLQTDAEDYFSHLFVSAVKGDRTIDQREVDSYQMATEDVEWIKTQHAKGWKVLKGEQYRYYRIQGLIREGDDWTGVISVTYPIGAVEILDKYDMWPEN